MFKYLKIYYRQYRLMPNADVDYFSLIKNYSIWKSSILPGKSTLIDGIPWMTFDAINFLRKHLNNKMRVFEYGSGGSSVFFTQLAMEVISVEHDKEWFDLVKKNLADRKINNWKGILCEPQLGQNSHEISMSDPDAYGTSDKVNRKFSFDNYVKSIDQYPDNHFDLIVIDGRSRPSCMKHSISKIKKNGFILLDNADRENYSDAITKFMGQGMEIMVSSFGPTSHNPEFTVTKIWRKV